MIPMRQVPMHHCIHEWFMLFSVVASIVMVAAYAFHLFVVAPTLQAISRFLWRRQERARNLQRRGEP